MENVEHFQFDEAMATFKVDQARRRIYGMIVPYGKVGTSGGARWKFQPGSLVMPADFGRVKLLEDHDMGRARGRGVAFHDREDGMWAEYAVQRGADGDLLLSRAEDGVTDAFSIGPAISPDGWDPDPSDPSVRLVRPGGARLVETSVVAFPAFDDARIASVVASREGATMSTNQALPGTPDPSTTPPPAPTPTNPSAALERFTAELESRLTTMADKLTEANADAAESMAKTVSDAFAAAFQRLEHQGATGEAAAARIRVISEPPVYRFDGDSRQPSLVKDSWDAHINRSDEAFARLRKFEAQQRDLVKFATVTTTTGAAVIPPGYRPDLYVTQLMQERPIVSLCSRGTLSDATPFTIPRFVSATGATADHVQGTNPTDGTLTLDTVTVTPGAVSGKFILTREIIDAANPAIDAIAMAAMRESWNRQTEQKVYTELNVNANVGTSSNVSLALLDTAAELLVDQTISPTRNLLALYPFTRFASPTGGVMGQLVTQNFALAQDTTGRKLLPSIGAQNTVGIGNAVQQGWYVDGLPFVPAWAITQNIGDELLLIVNRNDVWVWESPLLTFRFEEKSGPALIELALFGYFGTRVIRPAGIASLRAVA